MAKILNQSPAGAEHSFLITAPVGGLTRGMVVVAGAIKAFSATEAAEGDSVNLISNTENAVVQEAPTGVGSVTFAQGANVYWNTTTQEPAANNAGGEVLVGKALTEKTEEGDSFEIKFMGDVL